MKKAALVLFGLAVGFVAGYGTGRVSTGTPINPLTVGRGGYEEGYAAAAKKLADSGLVPPIPTEAYALNGTVVSVDNATLVFDADLRSPNPLMDYEAPARRTAHITSETKIVRVEPRTAEEMNEAQIAFEEAMASGDPVAPPEPLKRVPYTDALKAGDIILVEASVNILNSAAFDATAIVVLNAAP